MKTLGRGSWIILVLMVGTLASATPVKQTGLENIPDVLISANSEEPHEYAIVVGKKHRKRPLYLFPLT